MTKILIPPDDISKATSGIQLRPFDLAKEDPELLSLLKQHAETEKNLSAPEASASWYRSGSGPAPIDGGTWTGGTILTPISTPPASGIVSSIGYGYDNSHYGGWTSQISVRLLIVNAAQSESWVADITSVNSGTLGASGLNIPANCKMQFQMKVGNVVVALYNPPYISSDEATCYYNY